MFKPFLSTLVYRKTYFDHIEYLRAILNILRQYKLFVMFSKCKFGAIEVDYLEHLISAIWVKASPAKISSMLEWLVVYSLKSFRGFLGLTGQYRQFIKGYRSIAAPLIACRSKMPLNRLYSIQNAPFAHELREMLYCLLHLLLL